MIDRAKDLFYLYQRVYYYVANAKAEILKPLGFWNETVLILTYLAVKGENPSIWQIVGAYLLVLVSLALIGKAIVVLGITKYNAKINNHQNPEIMEIIERLARIEKNQNGG